MSTNLHTSPSAATGGHGELLQALVEGALPDADGRFGPFGGCYVPETLMPAIHRLTEGVYRLLPDARFQERLGPGVAGLGRAADGAHGGRAAVRAVGRRSVVQT